ncbi:MAG: hypothetical protein KGP28_09835 [Bdellovibrionales bacterium]|nr:hypothetical protein [Bdellovibrionales bacterium]
MKMLKRCFSVLGLFSIATSCTQLPPPRHGSLDQGAVSGGASSFAPGTFLSLDDSDPGLIKLTLSGDDAGKIFRLMGISAESGLGLSKVGRDFSCTKDGEKHACEFNLRIPDGTFEVQREESALKKSAPEMAQIKESNAYISIADPSERGKVRLQVLDAYAEKIFKSLQVPRTYDLTPDPQNGPGIRKAAGQVDCYERSKATTPDQKTHDCYLFLNTELGSLDSVDPSVQQ